MKVRGLLGHRGRRAADRFTFRDGFATADVTPDPNLPVSENEYTFEPTQSGTRAVYTSTFGSAEALEKVLEMGMEEGARSAIDQMDGFLAGSPRPV